jgi:hypothetical protein
MMTEFLPFDMFECGGLALFRHGTTDEVVVFGVIETTCFWPEPSGLEEIRIET